MVGSACARRTIRSCSSRSSRARRPSSASASSARQSSLPLSRAFAGDSSHALTVSLPHHSLRKLPTPHPAYPPTRILYDRLQSTVAPSNPYALHTVPHLSSLPRHATTSADPSAPPSILDQPTYPLADPSAPGRFLEQLNGAKLRAVEGAERWGDRPQVGVVGEVKRENGVQGAMQADQLSGDAAQHEQHQAPFPVLETAPGGMPLPPAGAAMVGAVAPAPMELDA